MDPGWFVLFLFHGGSYGGHTSRTSRAKQQVRGVITNFVANLWHMKPITYLFYF